MLDSLRKYANSPVAQVLMGILVLSFGAWGIADVFNGFRSTDIARVGSVEITRADFQREYTSTIRAIGRQVGQDLTDDQARKAGIPQSVMLRLVNRASLDNQAQKSGIGISDSLLASKIAGDPQFLSPTGKFDRTYLVQLIRSMGYTEDDFIMDQRRQYRRDQLAQALAGGITAPDTYLHAIYDYTSEQRSISYVVVTAPAASAIAEPSETDVNAYYTANKTEWDAPETRAVKYFQLTPSDVAKTEDVTDDEIRKAYDAQPDRFVTPETRDVQQIVFKDKAEADEAAASGKTFDQIMADRKLTPSDVDLGMLAKSKMADPKIADAAFALGLEKVSPVVDGAFGPAILRVTAISPGKTTTFEQAKADLKNELALQKAATDISSMHDAIEDARAGGATLAEAAAKYGLKVATVPAVDAQGKDASDKPIADLPQGLVAAAFQSDVGLQNDPIPTADNGYAWFDVTGVTAPRVRPLSEVHDQVVAAWKDAERGKQLDKTADDLKQRLENKEPFATVATSAGLTVKTADKLVRGATASGDLSADALVAAFATQQGHAAIAAGAEPLTKIVLTVDAVTVPPYSQILPEVAQLKQKLDGEITNDLVGTYVSNLQTEANVRYNTVALQQAVGGAATD